jgi:hypothetical protein
VEATLTQLSLDVAWTVEWQLMADWLNSHVPLVTDQAVWPNSPIASSGKLEKRQNVAGCLYEKFVDNALQCFAFMPQANFPAHNLNFHLI